MSTYNINDLEKLSGIKAHTIRIWEQRYKIITPARKSTNIWLYCDSDLKRILNIALLNKHGIKISKLADKNDSQLQEMVMAFMITKRDNELDINNLISAMIDLDEQLFLQTLSDFTQRNGFENTVVHLIYPFFDKVGVLWQTGNIIPAQEHFISNLVRQKLIVAIDSISLNQTEISQQLYYFYLKVNIMNLVYYFIIICLKKGITKFSI